MALFGAQEETVLKVTGMHCPKCVAKVKAALEDVEGVLSAEVDLDAEQAVVMGDADTEEMVAAIRAAGFEASLDA